MLPLGEIDSLSEWDVALIGGTSVRKHNDLQWIRLGFLFEFHVKCAFAHISRYLYTTAC